MDILDSGTPYWQSILAHKNIGLASAVIRDRILGTPFAISLDNFSVVFNETTRAFQVTGTLNTAFGAILLSLPTIAGPPSGFEIGASPLGGSGGLG